MGKTACLVVLLLDTACVLYSLEGCPTPSFSPRAPLPPSRPDLCTASAACCTMDWTSRGNTVAFSVAVAARRVLLHLLNLAVQDLWEQFPPGICESAGLHNCMLLQSILFWKLCVRCSEAGAGCIGS